MSISDRFRSIQGDVESLLEQLRSFPNSADHKGVRSVAKAVEGLSELAENVGDIPRIRLESQLTPVLLRAHSDLDRARLIFEEDGEEDRAAAIWELEQKIYRLLNDL